MTSYNHKEIEPKWMQYWDEHELFRTVDPQEWHGDDKKFYGLIEFPYPSGEGLHVGHPRSYTAMDIIARKRRMEGYHVLYPIGFDAFGLPAENYAIKTKTHPRITTQKNIQRFTEQLKKLGFSFDWKRAVDTTDPAYYKWTQWIFLQLFRYGLAYKSEIPINWCLNCKIGLANEEVVQGRCERCGGPVEKRLKSQWMLKITAYAERLLNDLDHTEYLEKIKTQQREWIGKKQGINITYRLEDKDRTTAEDSPVRIGSLNVTVFTTRPDTNFGATFVVIGPEHQLIANPQSLGLPAKLVEGIEAYKKETILQKDFDRTADDRKKTGVFTGLYCVNPLNGYRMPLYVADYVLGNVGTGAVVGVPGHDKRDFEFAKAFNIPVVRVVQKDKEDVGDIVSLDQVQEHEGTMINSGFLDGMNIHAATGAMMDHIEKEGYGKRVISYKLRDWVFSRQRYWGEPIPLVYCEQCASKPLQSALQLSIYDADIWQRIISGTKTIETRALNPDEPERFFGNIRTGDVITFVQKNTGLMQSVRVKNVWNFANIDELAATADLHTRIYGKDGLSREEITNIHASFGQNYVERMNANGIVAWEFELVSTGEILNPGWIAMGENALPLTLPEVPMYEPTDSGESPLATVTDWVRTQCPRCGGEARRETDTMPNWAGSSWYFLRYIDPQNNQEMASMDKLKYWMEVDWYNGGMEHTTLHLLYSRFWNKFLYDIGAVPTSEPYMKRTSHGMILGEGGIKMSKSKGNVVNPDDIIVQYGADTLRLYEMFMGPFDQAIPWDSKGVEGCYRFIQRVWKMVTESERIAGETEALQRVLHKTIKKVGADIDHMDFNTAISACMILLNEAQKADSLSKEFIEKFLIILSPFIPFVTEELWEKLGNTESVLLQKWPEYDEKLTIDDEVTIVVQINGKIRDSFITARDMAKEELFAIAKDRPDVKKWLEGKEVKKEIYVPNKMVSLVVG